MLQDSMHKERDMLPGEGRWIRMSRYLLRFLRLVSMERWNAVGMRGVKEGLTRDRENLLESLPARQDTRVFLRSGLLHRNVSLRC